MVAEDSEPRKQPELVLRKLDTLSVKGLEDYIIELETEIARVHSEIAKRGSARQNADSFFRKD
jgi:uncharacterized small protein (DUF1192 family)